MNIACCCTDGYTKEALRDKAQLALDELKMKIKNNEYVKIPLSPNLTIEVRKEKYEANKEKYEAKRYKP